MSAIAAPAAAMPAMDRVRRDSRSLVRAVIGSSVLWMLAALAVWLVVVGTADLAIGLSAPVRFVALPAGVAIAVMMGWRTWVRGRAARSPQQVALWIEERVPSLGFALVTLLDDSLTSHHLAARLETVVESREWSEPVRRAALRALAIPAGVLLGAVVLLLLLPHASVARVARPRPGDVLDGWTPLRHRGSILTPLVATITPPAYTGRRAETVEEPVSLVGIAGSEIAVEGRGDASLLHAQLGDSAQRASADGDRWRVRLRMPDKPMALRLGDGSTERLVTIEPYPDSVPVVNLRIPARDTVLRTAAGTFNLAADASDDIGLAETHFEYIITSGEMEAFTFRTGTLQHNAMHNERHAELAGTLALATLSLKPGDIIHLRAVASDGNTVTGPGRGASETRTIRIARQGEYDSVDVDALPSMLGDTAALSERMLIMLAEELQKRRPHLSRDTVVAESRSIAVDQARLRRRVSDIVFMRISGESSGEESEGDTTKAMTPEQVLAAAESAATRAGGNPLDFSADESPVIAVNRPLLEAYNAMWDAGRSLEIGEPADALPHMRAALAAIQRARLAERIYLRGRPPTQVVDLRDARLKGDRSGAAGSGRVSGPALGLAKSRMAARLAVATAIAGAAPLAAADSLLLLRLEALGSWPAFAGAASKAAADLRGGAAAAADLVRARSALLGEPRHVTGLGAWSEPP
ncbi:MAG TPA: hypothetical protein VGI92_08230 [Gemmatimonadales bacterium]